MKIIFMINSLISTSKNVFSPINLIRKANLETNLSIDKSVS